MTLEQAPVKTAAAFERVRLNPKIAPDRVALNSTSTLGIILARMRKLIKEADPDSAGKSKISEKAP